VNNLDFAMHPAPAEQDPVGISFGGAGGHAIRVLLRLLLKRWLVVLGIIAAALAIAVLYLLIAAPVYQSTATLEIARETVPVVATEEFKSAPLLVDQEFYETQFGLLRSEALASQAVRTLQLDSNPQFLPADTGGNQLAPAKRDHRFRQAVKKLMDSTTIVPARQSRLVDITIADLHPALAARIANTLAEAYMAQNLAKRVDRTNYARAFLEQRLDQTRRALELSERRLVGYAGAQQIISVPTSGDNDKAAQGTASQSLAGNELEAASQALIVAQNARIEAEARYNASRVEGRNRSEVLQNNAITSLQVQRAQLAGQVAQLQASYKSDYPPLVAQRNALAEINKLITDYQQRILSSIRSDYDASVQREDNLARNVKTLKANLIDLSNRSIEYTILKREVDTNRTLYDGLLQQYKQLSVATDLGSNNVNFVLRAIAAERPSEPKAARVLSLMLLIGIIAAVITVFVIEILDARIGTPEDFRERLSAPLLGIIPYSDEIDPLNALSDLRSSLTEAYSSMHANITLSTADGAPHVLALSSTRASEGKTTTALALALIFTRRGDRVVLIDGDMRRSSIHRRFGLSNVYGLSKLLSGEEFDRSKIEHYMGIDVITAGPPPPSPADLLATDRLHQLLDRLRQEYDRVIIDAPPVLGLVDAPLIASASDGVIFVVEADGPRLGPIRRSVERLQDSRSHMLGYVFTKYRRRSGIFSEYGAYDYYGYGYNSSKTKAVDKE
jgi:succinoglycan biosynthesis transport protein ExoP